MPDVSYMDLSKYRLERAADMLKTAKRDLEAEDYASANNRAYYCISGIITAERSGCDASNSNN